IPSFCFLQHTPTTEIYTLSLHDALPISRSRRGHRRASRAVGSGRLHPLGRAPEPRRTARFTRRASLAGGELHSPPHFNTKCQPEDRKSTRLNSSHSQISYAVFCLKKKKQ